MNDNSHDLSLKANEIQTIDDYLKNSKTSVLTILFTDIQGFTEYSDLNGDQKTSGMRQVHDQIMQEEIENNQTGKIIKFIGDAVMAIFSEPSAAVEIAVKIAVKIQRKLLHLYEIGEFPLKVRMGLHLGQVTIENKIGPDIFGGHVNKASRVESMANGGQIYATYSVVDSLKGQLDSDNISFHSHGEVSAKGLKDKFEIFEILFLRSQKPVSPVGFKEK
jgi:class 3 adenylate cyclase